MALNEVTFFQPDEVLKIAGSTHRDIVRYIYKKPKLATQFLHELWRTKQMEKMYNAMYFFYQTYDNDIIAIAEPNFPATIFTMVGTYGASINEVETFFADILGMQYRFDNGLDFNAPLDEQIHEGILGMVDGLLKPLEPQIKLLKDSLC